MCVCMHAYQRLCVCVCVYIVTLLAVGCVLAGWPFASIMGHYDWNTAYYAIELTSVSVVMVSLYLLTVMIKSMHRVKKD